MERDPDIERDISLEMKLEMEQKKKQISTIEIYLNKSFDKHCEKRNIKW